MLVSFSVSNFRSFRDEVTLTMVASNKLTDHPNHLVEIPGTGRSLVRTALLYGPNASGKSNLVKAMAYAQQMICCPSPGRFVQPSHFRGAEQFPEETATFELQFLIEDTVFSYGFDVSFAGVCGEWLSALRGQHEQVVFERDQAGNVTVSNPSGKHVADDESLFRTLAILAELPLQQRQLFLTRALSVPPERLGPKLSRVINWLTEDLTIVKPARQTSDVVLRLERDAKFQKFAGAFLKRLDTGVRNLLIKKRLSSESAIAAIAEAAANSQSVGMTGSAWSASSSSPPTADRSSSATEYQLYGLHQGSNADDDFIIDFADESEGTQQLLYYLSILYPEAEQGSRTVVIDELDRSLHPQLCRELIQLLSKSAPGARQQLIATTHEAHLLDQDLLRRDEYWIVEKDRSGQSHLTPLTEYKIRNDLNLRKGYLEGRFGGVPIVGDLSSLAELLGQNSKEGGDAPQEPTT